MNSVIPAKAGIQPETESYAYTLPGNLNYEINPDGSVTDNSYDAINRLTAAVDLASAER